QHARIVTVTRLQSSLHVAARVLASRRTALAATRALDTPLRKQGSLLAPGVCYSARLRLPRPDFHPLDPHGETPGSSSFLEGDLRRRRDAPRDQYSRSPATERRWVVALDGAVGRRATRDQDRAVAQQRGLVPGARYGELVGRDGVDGAIDDVESRDER